MKNLLKDKITQIAVWSAVINLILLWVVTSQFDLMSSVIYLVFAFIVGKIFVKWKKPLNNTKLVLMGAKISLSYNIAGHLLGWFVISPVFVIISAVQQIIITVIIGKAMGVKK